MGFLKRLYGCIHIAATQLVTGLVLNVLPSVPGSSCLLRNHVFQTFYNQLTAARSSDVVVVLSCKHKARVP